MEGKRKATEAQMRATAKWEKENYDKVLLRMPKGTKDRILNVGKSVNGYIVNAVMRQLQADETQSPPPADT